MKQIIATLVLITILLTAAWLYIDQIRPEVPIPEPIPQVLETNADAFLIYNGQENTVEIVKDSNAAIREVAVSGYQAMTGLVWGIAVAMVFLAVIVYMMTKKEKGQPPLSYWSEPVKKPDPPKEPEDETYSY